MFCQQMKENREAVPKSLMYEKNSPALKRYRGDRIPEFARTNPWVCFVYLLAVLIISMITYNPCIVAVSFGMSIVCAAVFSGVKRCVTNLLLAIPVLVFTLGIQPLFSRSGETVLFYFNDNAVSMESYLYGGITGMLLIGVIQWCSCIRVLLSGDRLIYILKNKAPALGLTFSMILRFIPLMRERYRQIYEAQAGLCGNGNYGGVVHRVRQFFKELSILISWSLESSIETSASMEARGYGKRKRTCYHNYRMYAADFAALVYIAALSLTVISEIILGRADFFYLPKLVFTGDRMTMAGITVLFIMLCGFPLLYEIRGEWKWRSSNLKI